MSEVESDFCIHGCYYMDTPEECVIDPAKATDCKREKADERFKKDCGDVPFLHCEDGCFCGDCGMCRAWEEA